jgi:hypothetical protein
MVTAVLSLMPLSIMGNGGLLRHTDDPLYPASYTADDPTDNAADRPANRTRSSVAGVGSFCGPTRNSLRHCCRWQHEKSSGHCERQKTDVHVRLTFQEQTPSDRKLSRDRIVPRHVRSRAQDSSPGQLLARSP